MSALFAWTLLGLYAFATLYVVAVAFLDIRTDKDELRRVRARGRAEQSNKEAA